jgi:roadblock/LC7 domain-containing protein
MNADILINEKKELRKLQKLLGTEMAKGKYKDTQKILQYKGDIKNKKLKIGNITKNMISQL